MSQKEINIKVEILPLSIEATIDLPKNVLITEVLDALIEKASISAGQEKKLGNYYLIHKASNQVLPKNQNLENLGIKEGDKLLMLPEFDVQSLNKKVIHTSIEFLKDVYEVELPGTSTIRMIKEAMLSHHQLVEDELDNYQLFLKSNLQELNNEQTIFTLGLEEGQTFLMIKKAKPNKKNKTTFKEKITEKLGLASNASESEILEEIAQLQSLINPKEDTFHQWLGDLAKGETSEVLKSLLRYCEAQQCEPDIMNDIIQQSNAWHSIHKERIKGLIVYEDFSVKATLINLALTQVVRELIDQPDLTSFQ